MAGNVEIKSQISSQGEQLEPLMATMIEQFGNVDQGTIMLASPKAGDLSKSVNV